jgi:UDP-N-acetylmuramoyl-L-alanyl-D-glutamate--2,6-diaminopimelate ligase
VSSHALEQGRAQPLTFRVVALTSFSQDHLDYHGTMAAYLAAKVRLAREHSDASSLALAAGRDRAAITQFLAAAAGAAWRVGSDGDAEVRIEQLEVGGSGLRMELRSPLGSVRLAAPLVGAHNADNAAIAATAALHLGIAADLIEAAGPTLVGAPGRMEPVTVPGIAGPQVLVDYAHTPDAVERALAAARAVCRGRLWVVLGCGGDRDAGKRPAMGAIAARDADVFVATSDNPRSEPPDAIVAAMLAGVAPARRDRVRAIVARDAAIRAAVIEADPDDLVLIAGKGHERQQILATGAIAFDDREHAAAALRAR